jgi:hypothetical protein
MKMLCGLAGIFTAEPNALPHNRTPYREAAALFSQRHKALVGTVLNNPNMVGKLFDSVR